MSDLIDRQQAIEALNKAKTVRSESGELFVAKINAQMNIDALPSAELGTNLAEVGTDCISRQAAIDAVLKCYDNNELFEVYEDKLRALPAEPHWIPVTERLPERKNQTYWICTDCGYQCEARWTDDRFGLGKGGCWGWHFLDYPQYTKVVAWMPLPEPYKGVTE